MVLIAQVEGKLGILSSIRDQQQKAGKQGTAKSLCSLQFPFSGNAFLFTSIVARSLNETHCYLLPRLAGLFHVVSLLHCFHRHDKL